MAYPESFKCQYTCLASELYAQIRGKLMQNSISDLLISSIQMHLHHHRDLSNTHKNVCKPYVNLMHAYVCYSNLFKYITMYHLYKEIKPFHSTSVPKETHGYGTDTPKFWLLKCN